MIGSRLRLAFFGFALVTSVGVSSTSSFAAGPELVPVLQSNALVRTKDDGDFAPMPANTKLAAGNAVRAPADAIVSIKVNGVGLELEPGAAITLRAASWLPPEHPGAHPLRALSFTVTNGEVDLDAHDPANAVGALVSLPGGDTLGVWRGSTELVVKDDVTTVAVFDGTAIAGSASKWKPLSGGNAITLGKKGEFTSRTLPDGPTWNDGSRDALSFALVRGDDHAGLGLAWNAAANAASYRVEIARDPSMKGPLAIHDEKATTFKTEPLVPGAYYARVRAVSSEGIASKPTSIKPIRVAHITVPSNAVSARDGVIVLPPSAAVLLDDPRDLEYATAVDGAKMSDLRWAPAPDRFSLSGAPRRALFVRQASSHTGDTPITLVRRELEAHVTMGPKPAKWPKDPIEITVKLEDKSGYIDPSKEPINADVRVDIDKVDVAWKHAGDTWTARVPPRTSGTGPWVVRVYVKDRAGVDIGAGLLDVDGPQQPGRRGDGMQQVVYSPQQ